MKIFCTDGTAEVSRKPSFLVGCGAQHFIFASSGEPISIGYVWTAKLLI